MKNHIILLGGDEPYMIDVKRSAVVKNLQLPELNYMTSEVFDENVVNHLSTMPMMDDERIAFVKVDNLKKLDTPLFKEYLKDPIGKVVVQFREWDERTSLYKELHKMGVICLCNKKDAYPSLKKYLEKAASKLGATFSENALQVMLDRVCYADNEGCNIYTLFGYIHSLSAMGKVITPSMVCDIVPEFQNEDRFKIIRMILANDTKNLRIQAELLKKDAIGVLSLLLREYRIAYKAFYYPLKDVGVTFSVLAKEPKERITKGIDVLTAAVADLKTGNAMQDTLYEVFLRLTEKGGKE